MPGTTALMMAAPAHPFHIRSLVPHCDSVCFADMVHCNTTHTLIDTYWTQSIGMATLVMVEKVWWSWATKSLTGPCCAEQRPNEPQTYICHLSPSRYTPFTWLRSSVIFMNHCTRKARLSLTPLFVKGRSYTTTRISFSCSVDFVRHLTIHFLWCRIWTWAVSCTPKGCVGCVGKVLRVRVRFWWVRVVTAFIVSALVSFCRVHQTRTFTVPPVLCELM